MTPEGTDARPAVLEFFAGGGMARLGLGDGWRTAFVNEWDAKKAAAYGARFATPAVREVDVATLEVDDLPAGAALAWASFPCQDLSLAGGRAGLDGARSGTFHAFWRLMRGLRARGDAPPLVVLENVPGLVTSAGGRDFVALIEALADGGYRVAPLIMDAKSFVPQSRPRLFVVAVDAAVDVPDALRDVEPSDLWHPRALRRAVEALPFDLRRRTWWAHPPAPPRDVVPLETLVEETPSGVEWHAPEETA
ncbi:MAG TPA: DNA (cytosine-5-)-methyltransferase, partial [Planctomycetota bacterium]|nr:DNA (cytosine-5-)-methyltransferase [Planctomycetota bacterium]